VLIREIFNAEGNREELICQGDDEIDTSSNTKYLVSKISALKLKMNIKHGNPEKGSDTQKDVLRLFIIKLLLKVMINILN
jgi:hypothetical protein